MSSRLSVSPAIAVALTAAVVVAIAIILLAANVTVTNAQQLTSQPPAVTQNGTTTLFQNTDDSIRVQVPEGWAIQDVNNTGTVLSDEARLGYGILAQLCPQEEEEEQPPQQQQRGAAAALSNVSGSGGGSSNTAIC